MTTKFKTNGSLRPRSGEKWITFRNANIANETVVADCETLDIPSHVLSLFQQFESHVLAQEFSLLDEIGSKIEALGLKVLWEGQDDCDDVFDVQLIEGRVSFRIRDN